MWPDRMEFGCGARNLVQPPQTFPFPVAHRMETLPPLRRLPIEYSPPDPHVVSPGLFAAGAPDHPNLRREETYVLVSSPPGRSLAGALVKVLRTCMHQIPDFHSVETVCSSEQPMNTDMYPWNRSFAENYIFRSTFPPRALASEISASEERKPASFLTNTFFFFPLSGIACNEQKK